MSDLKPCPFCGGEANVKIWCEPDTPYLVMCESCKASVKDYATEAEAIEAWNRRVDDHFRGVTKMVERTAKVEELPQRSETSLDWEGICSNCGAYTNHDMNYCFECGSRLEWSE